MPPTSDGLRTVGCNLQKLVPDAGQLDAIRQAVASTHKATILVTELLNTIPRVTLDMKNMIAREHKGELLVVMFRHVFLTN